MTTTSASRASPADAPSARLQIVVAGGAPCDFRVLPADSERLAYWLGGTPAEKPDAYREASPTNYVTADDPPMFFFHGAATSWCRFAVRSAWSTS